jgi:hypothetical protein
MTPPPKLGGPPVTDTPQHFLIALARWLKPENRCRVPFNSFAAYAPEPLLGALENR